MIHFVNNFNHANKTLLLKKCYHIIILISQDDCNDCLQQVSKKGKVNFNFIGMNGPGGSLPGAANGLATPVAVELWESTCSWEWSFGHTVVRGSALIAGDGCCLRAGAACWQ